MLVGIEALETSLLPSMPINCQGLLSVPGFVNVDQSLPRLGLCAWYLDLGSSLCRPLRISVSYYCAVSSLNR